MIVKHSSDETPKPMPVGLRLARVISIGNGTVDVCPIGSSVVLHDIPVTSATTMQVGDVINLQMMDNKRFAFAQQNVTSASESSEKTVTIVNAAAESGGGGSGSTGTLTVGSGLSVNPASSGNLGGAVSLALDASVARSTWNVVAGSGLTGGGSLSPSGITLNVGAGNGIAVAADSVSVKLAATSGLSFATDALQVADSIAGDGLQISSKVLAVDSTVVRTSREIATGNGLTGGGDLTASRTLAVGAGNGISVLTETVAVNQAYAFTWSAAHTFSANATFSAGLTATRLTGSSNVLELANATSFQSVSFNAGFAGDGWRITRPSGASTKASFETDNLTVRGSMRVYELLINQVRATNGSVLVSSTGKVAAATYVSGTGGAVGVTYDFATDDNTAHGFAANDIIIAKRATGTDPFTAIMRVASTPAPTATTWRGVLLYADGANPSSSAAHIGLEFARIGNTTTTDRQGSVYLSADDSGAPFVQVSDGVAAAADWNAAGKVRVKLGNLNGSYGYAANTYGFAAGNSATTFVSADATNGFRVVRDSTTRFQVDTAGNLSVNNSAGTPVISMDTSGNASIAGVLNIGASGEIRQGTGAWSSTFTGTRLWNDSGVGRIAGYNAGALQWSADSDGKLKTAGGQAVWDSSGLLLNSNQGEFPSGFGFTGSYRFGSWTATGGWGNTDLAGLKHRYGFRLATTTLYNNDTSAYNVISIDASAGSTGLIQLKGTDIEARGTLWFTADGTQDTNLYRLSAGNLKTDDTLIVAGGLNVGGATGAGTGDAHFSNKIQVWGPGGSGGTNAAAASANIVGQSNSLPSNSGSGAEAALRIRGSNSSNVVVDIGASGISTVGWIEVRNATDYSIDYALLINPNGGNVAVGRASAAYGLHVGGTLGVTSEASFLSSWRSQLTVGSSGNAGAVGFRRGNGDLVTFIGYSATSEAANLNFQSGGGGGYFTWSLQVNGQPVSEVMRLSNSGRLGIGTNNPQYAVDAASGSINTEYLFRVSGTQVVGARKTGWAAASGTATRTSFATSTVTTAQLAERVKALIDDLISHGLIGA